jgi:2'-5' RNA ligase
MEKVRSFIAIELPEDLKTELGRLQAKLKIDRPRIKWVSPEGIHLTLKFLGDVDTSRIAGITQALTEAVRGINPFDLNIGHLGVFPNPQMVQVVWIGLDGELDTLDRLYHNLEGRMALVGFSLEKREFKPHLTLARIGDEVLPDDRKRFGDFIASSKEDIVYALKAKGLSLMKSQLTPRGAIYTRLSYIEFSPKSKL